MDCEAMLDKNSFKKMEEKIMKEVVATSKAMIASFEFRMIYGSTVDSKIAKKTERGLKEFRDKNWDSSLPRDEAYKKYLNLY
jgi:hypothetical protein